MVFVETSVFTRRIQDLMPEDDYAELQDALIRDPRLGALIPGSGGLRKLRWSRPGMGRRGGARVIYYWITEQGRIYMLYAFAKGERSDLTRAQHAVLRRVVEDELHL